MKQAPRLTIIALKYILLLPAVGRACLLLPEWGNVLISSAGFSDSCAEFTIAAGHPTQIHASSDYDLAFHLTAEGTSRFQDGFEFGRETLTVDKPGQYRVTVKWTGVDRPNTKVLLSRKPVRPDEAAVWEMLEETASASKGTHDLERILATANLWHDRGDPSGGARADLMTGDAHLRNGDIAAARDLYRRALDVCRKLAELRCVAEAANNAGLAERQLGNFEPSRGFLEEAAKQWDLLKSWANKGKTLSNLGILYSRIGDYQESISAYDRALPLLASRDRLVYGRVLNNLGLAYLSLADQEKALVYFTRAIGVEARLPNGKADLLRARLNLGRALMLIGRVSAASLEIKAVLEQSAAQSDQALRGYALNNLGQALLKLNRSEEAELHLTEALKIHSLSGDRRWEAIATYWLGEISRRRGDLDPARNFFSRSLQIRHETGLRDEETDSLEGLARLEWEAGNSDRAKELAERAIAVLEAVRSHVPGAALRSSFLAQRRSLFSLLVSISMRPRNPNFVEDGFLAAERSRARALLDLISDRQVAVSLPPDLVHRRSSLRGELGLLSYRLSSELKPSGLHERVASLLAEDDAIEARMLDAISRDLPDVRVISSLTQFRQDALPAGSALVEFHLGNPSSHVWVLRTAGIESYVLPSESEIDEQVRRACGLLSDVGTRVQDPAKQAALRRSLGWLSEHLLGQIRDLPGRVILVPDGSLHRLPFPALKLATGAYFGLNHDLIRVPSASYLEHGHPVTPAARFPLAMLSLADPVFTGDDPRISPQMPRTQGAPQPEFARLPFTAELDVVASLISPSRLQILRGFEATPASLRLLNARQAAILHLSTHAVIDDRVPELSRIVLSMVDRRGNPTNGYVLPSQMAGLRLNGTIVVISACQTALGKQVFGEGMVGFANSLFSAGAAQLVLTLSDVDAQAASAFLSEVYRAYFARGGGDMERAMTIARRSMAHSDRWSDPAYWAAFSITGTPTLRSPRSGGR